MHTCRIVTQEIGDAAGSGAGSNHLDIFRSATHVFFFNFRVFMKE